MDVTRFVRQFRKKMERERQEMLDHRRDSHRRWMNRLQIGQAYVLRRAVDDRCSEDWMRVLPLMVDQALPELQRIIKERQTVNGEYPGDDHFLLDEGFLFHDDPHRVFLHELFNGFKLKEIFPGAGDDRLIVSEGCRQG